MDFTLLIADAEAADYERHLAKKFPGIRLLVATDAKALAATIEDADALLTFGVDLDSQILGRARRLRWIQALSTGTDRISPLIGPRPEIILTSARGAHGAPVSEMAFLLMLALARKLPTSILNQEKHVWDRQPGTLLHGKTVGIAGIGVIGDQIAQRAKAFGMRTIGFGTSPRPMASLDDFLSYSQLPAAAPELDMLVIVTPATAATTGMFGRQIFQSMKRSAFVVNVSRGAVVDEPALIDALQRDLIAGAALDVFSREPLDPGSPFWSLNNVIVTPHCGGAHDRYAEFVLPIVEKNLQFLLDGREAEMINRVDYKHAGK